MNRRTILKRLGATTAATLSIGIASAGDDCADPTEDEDCQFNKQCGTFVCPEKCCDCLCVMPPS